MITGSGLALEEANAEAATTTTTTPEMLSATLYGDVNVDGQVGIEDVILLNRLLAEDTAVVVTDVGVLNADCVYDGVPDGDDATAILRLLAGFSLPMQWAHSPESVDAALVILRNI